MRACSLVSIATTSDEKWFISQKDIGKFISEEDQFPDNFRYLNKFFPRMAQSLDRVSLLTAIYLTKLWSFQSGTCTKLVLIYGRDLPMEATTKYRLVSLLVGWVGHEVIVRICNLCGWRFNKSGMKGDNKPERFNKEICTCRS